MMVFIDLYVTPNRRAIEELQEVLIFNQCQILFFFSIFWECLKIDIISLFVVLKSCDLTNLKLSPAQHSLHIGMKVTHFS